MIDIVKLSYRIFGKYIDPIESVFIDVQDDLRKAGIKFTLKEYLSLAIFTVVLTFFFETVLMSFIFSLLGVSPLYSVLLSFTLSSSISGIIFFLFYSYPATSAKNRERKIDKALPFGVSYLASISSGKVTPITMFRTISMFKEYGELAEEAKTIVKNVENFGMTLSASIKRQAERTPSKNLKDVLWGINTTLLSGGDITGFLKEKTQELMEKQKRDIRKYSQDLSLFIEIYLTLIITGSIFFIVLSSIISTMTGGMEAVAVQTFVVFLLLPAISSGFILLIKSISPTE